MTRTRASSVDQLVERIVQAEIAEAAALERLDTRAQNRCADRLDAAIRELLSQGEAGRTTLEKLLQHERPMIRLAAASKVLEWDPDRAVPIFEQLLAWAFLQQEEKRPGVRPMVASFVLHNAKYFLAQHYGIQLREVVPHVLSTAAGAVVQPRQQ
jgi:hypothetical protein